MSLTVVNPVAVLLLLLVSFDLSIKSETPEMTERLPLYSITEPKNVPFIIVGSIVESASPAGNFHVARYDEKLHTRRYQVKVQIEKVLQGTLISGSIVNIYFFIEDRSFGTSERLFSFPKGSRDLFFLQPDYRKLRTIADQSPGSCVVRVLSGAHPNFKRDLTKPVVDDILRILLTRGEGISDKEMGDMIYNAGIYRQFGDSALIRALRQVENTETPLVREMACSTIKSLGYSCKEMLPKR